MSIVFRYSDLKMDRVDSLLSADGEVLISLPPKHAKACIALIETVRATRGWGKIPFLARLAPLMKGLWVTLRILLSSPRLFELRRVVVLNSSSHSWKQESDGNVLFRFAR